MNGTDQLREVFSYIRQFRGRTFVVKIDCSIINHALFALLAKDIALIHESGIRIVLVPGAKERIDEVLQTYRVKDRFVNGVRIVDQEGMPFIKMAAFDVSNRLMTVLAANDITGVIGNWVRARGMGVIEGIDHLSAGLVEKVQVETVRKILDDGLMPIFPCIGWSAVGKPYNISSNELAAVVAAQLSADKLFYITAHDGLFASSFKVPEGITVAPDGRLANFSLPDLERFLEANPERTPELDYLRRAHRACAGGVQRVHVLDGRIDGVILREIFSSLGFGTMVYADQYGGIRPMAQQDVSEVLRIMQPFVDKGLLLPRNAEHLAEQLKDYIVFELDGSVRACSALHHYSESDGEIAAVAVDENYAHMGVGLKMVGYLLERARAAGLSRVFTLTTHAADWFEKLGFVETEPSALPRKRLETYSEKRRSLVYYKALR